MRKKRRKTTKRKVTKRRKKRGQVGMSGAIGGLVAVVLAIVVVGLMAGFTQEITSDVRTDFYTGQGCQANETHNCDYDYNASTFTQQGVDNVSKKIPTVGTIAVAAVLIALLVGAFAFALSRR